MKRDYAESWVLTPCSYFPFLCIKLRFTMLACHTILCFTMFIMKSMQKFAMKQYLSPVIIWSALFIFCSQVSTSTVNNFINQEGRAIVYVTKMYKQRFICEVLLLIIRSTVPKTEAYLNGRIFTILLFSVCFPSRFFFLLPHLQGIYTSAICTAIVTCNGLQWYAENAAPIESDGTCVFYKFAKSHRR